MKLLVVDSDRDLVEMLMNWLKTTGFDVHRAYDVQRAKEEWLEHHPDLVIVDSALKDGDALEMCREMRSVHDALVLVVTDGKGVSDEVHCLNAGADDYLRKPFYPAQLLARIRALIRRARSSLQPRPSAVVNVGPISVDSLHNEVSVHGKTFRLTPKEGKMLHFLATNINDVCTANQIVTHVWGYGGEGDMTLIKAHIRHLRQKIEPIPSKPRYILTVPGVGYSMVRPSAEKEEVRDVVRQLKRASS
jgi:DNA-binding response OmpR family regulator